MLKTVAIVTVSLTVLLVLTPSEAGMLPGKHHNEKSLIYFLYEKTIAQCYGTAYAEAIQNEMRTFFEQCMEKEWEYSNAQAEKYAEEEAKASEKQALGVDELAATTEGGITTVSDALITDEVVPRRPFFPVSIIRPLKDEVFRNARIVSCLFDSYNLSVSENGTVDASSYIQHFVNDDKIPEDVKVHLLDGISTCQLKSENGDFLIWGSNYVNFHKILKFYRCVEDEKLMSCMLKDLNDEAANFDLSGLDNALGDADDLAKRLFVISSYANWDKTDRKSVV